LDKCQSQKRVRRLILKKGRQAERERPAETLKTYRSHDLLMSVPPTLPTNCREYWMSWWVTLHSLVCSVPHTFGCIDILFSEGYFLMNMVDCIGEDSDYITK
jgi:hypothetical protein